MTSFDAVDSSFDPRETAGIGLDNAGTNGEPLTADQARRHAAADRLLEDLAQDAAVAEAAVPVHRETRVVGNLVLKLQPAKPPIGQVEIDIFTKLTIKADRVAITDNQHSDHQFRINRRTARMAVLGGKLSAKPA